MRFESRRLYVVDCAKSECNARASVEEYDLRPVRDSVTRRARLTLDTAQFRCWEGGNAHAAHAWQGGEEKGVVGGKGRVYRHCECAATLKLNLMIMQI